MVPLKALEDLLRQLIAFDRLAKSSPSISLPTADGA
jgi:hypothetical protein